MSLPNTHLGSRGVGALLRERKKLHFIGIGGVHMASLARMARARGWQASGSDLRESTRIGELRRAGIPVLIGHRAANLREAEAVIYTLALSPDNPEYLAALEKGLPVISRAELLGYLTQEMASRICVAGSHGKSTVCAMLADIFVRAGRAPTVLCGAQMPQYGSAFLEGEGSDCILEACEYGDSHLALSPTTALVLNLDFDHADYFESIDALASSFARFAALAGPLGNVICNAEDAALCTALAAAPGRRLTFGLSCGDCHAEKITYVAGRGQFSLIVCGERQGEVCLRVPGEHNVKNALAAALTAAVHGIPYPTICAALSQFSGASRRLSYRGRLRGAALYDDYAHHPAEIVAGIDTARKMAGTGRVFVVFQPHTYTRTAALFGELCTALSRADRVFVADIYPARETDTLGMSAARLAEGIGAHAAYVGDNAAILGALLREVTPADTVLIMGAGDIDRIFTQICPKDFTLA